MGYGGAAGNLFKEEPFSSLPLPGLGLRLEHIRYRNQGRLELSVLSHVSKSDWVRTAQGHGTDLSGKLTPVRLFRGAGRWRENVFVFVCLDYHPIYDW